MPTITVTPEPAHVPPRVLVEVDLSDVTPSPPATTTVTRVDGLGRSPVRTAEPATLSGGTWVGYDYEAPFGVFSTWQVTTPAGTLISSAPATLDVPGFWLRHISVPDLSVEVTRLRPESFERITNTARRGIFRPVGRSAPIVVTSGARGSDEFDLVVRTNTLEDEQAVRNLLADETPLLIGLNPAKRWGLPQAYVSVGDVTRTRVINIADREERALVLPCVVVDRPVGGVVAQRTYNDIPADFTSYNEVSQAYADYNDLTLDVRVDPVPDA